MGVSVTVTGSTAVAGTAVTITATNEGTAQPPGTGHINLGSARFYDVCPRDLRWNAPCLYRNSTVSSQTIAMQYSYLRTNGFFAGRQERLAQAFDSLATELRSGTAAAAVTPRAWFENNLGPGGTVNLATADASDIISGTLGSLVNNQIDPALMSLGKSTVLNQQFQDLFYGTDGAWSNYNSLFVSLHAQSARGLTFAANYTWAHCSDLGGSVQDNLSGPLTDSYNPGFDYGDCITDRRHSFTAYGVYQLPFAKGNRFLGGWHISLIFSAYTGLPIDVTQSGSVSGDSFGTESVPLVGGAHLPSQGVHYSVTGSDGVGTAGAPADGGTGVNLFANPEAAFNDFRPFLISQDTRSSRGAVRDPSWWNTDASVGKTFKVREDVKIMLCQSTAGPAPIHSVLSVGEK